MLTYYLAATLACAAAAAIGSTPTPHGVLVALADGTSVELAVEGLSSFRVSIANGSTPAQMETLMIADKTAWAQFSVATVGTAVNLSTRFGSVSVDTASGVLALADAGGNVLTSTTGPVSVTRGPAARRAPASAHNDTCAPAVVHNGTDVYGPERAAKFPNGLSGQTEAECCAACNSDDTCIAWVWSDGTHPDPAGNCWPLSGYSSAHSVAGRVLGGFTPPPPPPPPGTTSLTFSTSASNLFYGSGADMGSASQLTRTGEQATVYNRGSYPPSFYATDGYALQAVSPFPNTAGPGKGGNDYPMKWSSSGSAVTVDVLGGTDGTTVDFYLTPASSLRAFVSAQAALQGTAALLPRYAFGFLACRWGWVNQSYIEGVLAEFRSGAYPVDVWISDFEWFTARPDYTLPPQGDPWYTDFTFNNVTFPGNASLLLAHYREAYNFRFGGIRKPRLGNSQGIIMAASKGWLMGQGGVPGAQPDGTRNLNYSHANGAIDDMFDWYVSQNNFYLDSGVSFFWNGAWMHLPYPKPRTQDRTQDLGPNFHSTLPRNPNRPEKMRARTTI